LKVCIETASRPQAKHVFRCALLKNTQKVRNMHCCSSCIPGLIKMGGQYIMGNLFWTF